MSKKRAFVRYTKSGEIVPGSLIITTNGGYPDKSSIWKEIQTYECCDGGGGDCSPISIPTTCEFFDLIPSIYGFNIYFRINNSCSGFVQQQQLQIFREFLFPVSNAQDVVDLIDSDVVCQENGITAVLNTSDPEVTTVSINLSKCKCLYANYGNDISAIVSINFPA